MFRPCKPCCSCMGWSICSSWSGSSLLVALLTKLKNQRNNITNQHPPVKAVVNLSSRQLSHSEETVLNKGLNFATTTNCIPYLDIITHVEELALRIPTTQGNEIRWKVRQVLEKAKPPKSNITQRINWLYDPYRVTAV